MIGYRFRFGSFVLFLVSAAQAQTAELACKVKWEPVCIDARLIKQQCPPVLATETSSGALRIDGPRAATKNLGVVTDYALTRKGANEIVLEGAWTGPGQYIRGHGTLDTAAGKLRLYLTLGKDRNDHDTIQRGLEGECR